MKHLKITPRARVGISVPVKLLLFTAVVCHLLSCSKSNGSGSSGPSGPSGNSNPLLSKEVLIAKNSAGMEVDSVVTLYQYDASKHLIQTLQTSVGQFSGVVSTTGVTYNLVYTNNLPTSLTGTVTQSIVNGAQTYSATTQIATTFQATGNQVTSFVQKATTTGNFTFPLTQETGNDSAVLAYDASGNVNSYNVFQIPPGSSTYQPLTQQTFTYSMGNLTQWVDMEYVAGIQSNTVTSVYQYNSQSSAAPFFIIPGIPIASTNDLSKQTQTSTGVNAQTITTTYTTTYNSTNQPLNSTATVNIAPTDPNSIATETISYTY
jgi:hypothetical protein